LKDEGEVPPCRIPPNLRESISGPPIEVFGQSATFSLPPIKVVQHEAKASDVIVSFLRAEIRITRKPAVADIE
jgi:hypothetical protein